jgi:HAD superfamily hydrolase (TIGR01509 family)
VTEHLTVHDRAATLEGVLPVGVVFDCDGTLADTESISDRAWREMLAGYGYEATEADFRAVIGHPFPQNWAYFTARVDLGEQAAFRHRLRARFVELFEDELELHDDAVGTLRQLVDLGIPVAVASSSSHGHVRRVLERADLEELVRVVIGADDVERHKPDPTPYVVAAERLGIAPEDCAAVEDTPVGVASAVGAGMFTVGVVRAHGDPAALADAHRVVDHVTIEALRRPPTEEPR